MVVILKNDGTPVTLDSSFTFLAFDIHGFILEFTFKENLKNKFKYYQIGDFKPSDIDKYPSLTNGYYLESEFLNYFYQVNQNETTVKDLISKHKFNFDKYISKAGDLATVAVTHLDEPFNFYYKSIFYTFEIENTSDNKGIKRYIKSILQYGNIIDREIDIPPDAIQDIRSNDKMNQPTGYFYTKNFGKYVNNWSISNSEKHNFKKIATQTSFRIAEIVNVIFPKIISSASLSNIDFIANSPSGNIESLSPLERMIFELKRTWGFFYDPTADIVYKYKQDFEPTLSGEPNYKEYSDYYSNLTQFYYGLYEIQDKLININVDLRLRYLLEILPVTALTIVPYTIIKSQFLDYSTSIGLPENSQRFVVHMMISLTIRNGIADDFLGFLLKKGNGITTIFEVIYKSLSDDRLERYPVVNWFVDEQSNRKHFVYAVYELWKISKFNFYYLPDNVQPNEDGINSNSFFLNEGKRYYPKYDSSGKIVSGASPILEFSVTKSQSAGNSYFMVNSIGTSYKPKPEFNGEEVVINEVTTTYYTTYNPYGTGTDSSSKLEKVYGQYHLYQPISLLGYEANLDLDVPNLLPIPTFLFFYAVEYDKLKDFDSAIIFATEVTIDLALFYFTGGSSILRHLKYLKYVSEINNVRKGLVTGEVAVLFWRGVETGSEFVALTAGVLSSFFSYQSNISNNAELANLNKKLSFFFMMFALSSVGNSINSRNRAVRAADNVLAELTELSRLGIPHDIPADVLEVLNKIKGLATVSKALFRNRITTLTVNELGEANHIADIYDNVFTELEREDFWRHFADKTDNTPQNVEFWKQINKSEGGISAARAKAWRNSPVKFKEVRKELSFLNEVIKLDITDRKAYDHLAEFANRPKSGKAANSVNVTGGHKFNLNMDGSTPHQLVDNGIEILDPNYSHSIVNATTSQKMKDYLNRIGNKVYTKTPKSGGHFQHQNILTKADPQPNTFDINNEFVLNGTVYKMKATHMQLNPSWTETDIIYEYSYALSKKKNPSVSNYKLSGEHGRTDRWYETTYESTLMDGTHVDIKHVNYHRYNLQNTFNDHYSYFQLNF
ncbi:hypothetical protein [Pedobacter sp.]|uniref:hypothetical protein n=1 Tax=Pedobacter sp. TaxID=1411316 RepID=UPI0031D05EDF